MTENQAEIPSDHEAVLAETQSYIMRLMDNTGGAEATFDKALDIIERALKDKTFAQGAMHAAADALRLVLEGLDKEYQKLDAEDGDET